MTKSARQKKISKIKQKQKKLQFEGNCPTPDKKWYPSRSRADKYAMTSSIDMGTMYKTYMCICGGWHLTTKR